MAREIMVSEVEGAVRLLQRAERAEVERDQAIAEKDRAYGERNLCVALLARLATMLGWRAGVREHEGPDLGPGWRSVVLVNLPTGQLSWHLPDREADLLEHLPRYVDAWDGHTTEEKHLRMRLFLAAFGA